MKKIIKYQLPVALSSLVLIATACSNVNNNSNHSKEDSGSTGITKEIVYRAIADNEDDWYDHRLQAVVDGKEYNVPLDEDICFHIECVMDFDKDGYLDALIMDVISCGGNAVEPGYRFVSFDGEDQFKVSELFGIGSKVEYEVTEDGYKLKVTEKEWGEGDGYDLFDRWYILQDGQAMVADEQQYTRIEGTLKEITVDAVRHLDLEDCLPLTFDLNEDGIMDTIYCRYWERWDAIMPYVNINGISYSLTGASRIGVLPTMTNGYHDILVGDYGIASWQDSCYVDKD